MRKLPEEIKPAEVIPGVRGVPLRFAAKGTLARFLPASLAVMGAFTIPAIIEDPGRLLIVLGIMGLEALGLSAGFGAGLLSLRRWLFPSAKIEGRRSSFAGLMSPLALGIVSIFTQGASLIEIGSYSALAGLGMAVVLYSPWLSSGGEPAPEVPPEDQSSGEIPAESSV
jgi:hypothetical protein